MCRTGWRRKWRRCRKSLRIAEGLRPLLGNSVFVTNGEVWKRQRRIIDPAFEGGRLRQAFPAMVDAARATVSRITPGVVEVEEAASHAAADVIFRTLFSIPIEDAHAQAVFREFRDHQRTQPILNLGAFLPLPHWFPRLHRRRTKATAARIRALITDMTTRRAAEIAAGTAPDDLATKIMVTADPVTGERFATGEMVDQVAIFFLAGHETSASALAWGLYLLATHPPVQDRVAAEVSSLPENPAFADLSKLKFTRDVFREVLRLYPPVPMMVRQNLKPETFRDREVAPGAQVVLSPWHLHRHERLWADPDAFDPDRWQTEAGKASARDAWMPFSAGPRVCTGAGFAMAEGMIVLAMLVREAAGPEEFRGRKVKRGAQVVISPWHLHRHERLWENPDGFDPDRWAGEVPQGGYLPFSRGARVCPGAGFAMLEGTLMLAHLVRAFRFEAVEGRVPVPVAHLTVRAKDGIWLEVSRRDGGLAPTLQSRA